MKKFFTLFLIPVYLQICAQDKPTYILKSWIDYPVTVSAVAGTFLTYPLREKKVVDTAFIRSLSLYDLGPFNRHAARQNDFHSDGLSDIFFISGFVIPFVLAAEPDARKEWKAVSVLFLQTMAVAGTLDGICAGTVKRLRPYAYNPDVPFSDKTNPNVYGSFYGSHPSFTAAGAFFFAKVFSDLNPGSHLNKFLWPSAALVSLASGYFRYRGGHHFVSDIAVGIGVGTTLGIVIPALHKSNADERNISIQIYSGPERILSLVFRPR